MKILIAEDQGDDRLLLQKLLEAQGYEVETATNGLHALDIARRSPPELIISDLLMPAMDGFTFCRTVKGLDRLRAIPFLVYTGSYTENQEEQLVLALGADRYLVKPQTPEKLLKAVEELLAEKLQDRSQAREGSGAKMFELESMYREVVTRKLDQKSAELELQQIALEQSEARFRAISESAQDAILLMDNQGLIVYWNPAAERIIGYSQEEALGRVLIELLAPERFNKKLTALFSLFIQQDRGDTTSRNLELHLLRKDGLEFPVELSLASLRLHGQRQILVMLRDITERKQAERKLSKERSFLQSVIDGVGDPILVISRDYKVILANKEAKKMAEDLNLLDEPMTCYQLSHHRDTPCSSAEYPCPMRSVLETGKPARVVHQHLTHNSRTRTYELLATPLHGEDGGITGIIESARDITSRLQIQNDLEEKERSLQRLAHHDTLTDLPNRLLFFDRLNQALYQAHRSQTGLALLFIDLDHFKEINDGFGHTLGDELLRAVSRRLAESVREDDTVARLGGDEFTVIMGQLEHSRHAGRLAQKLLQSLMLPIRVDDHDLTITASVGISLYPEDGTNTETLLRNADSAMYRAKEEGRNTFQFYTEDMTSRAFERVHMEAALRQALKQEQLAIHYQPQVELVNGHIVGAEALLRWWHPEQGLISPTKFIPIAEESGQIIEIGEWVLNRVCGQIKAWQREGYSKIPVAVNLSIKQLNREGLIIQTVQSALAETRCDAAYLELEVTESSLMRNPEQAIKELEQLRNLGIGISIDDFGTGYSSLSYLKKFPLSKLKIDRTFVRDIPFDSNDQAISRAVIAVAKSLGLKVIAEGVENEEQREFLIAEGCDECQGFYYSKPLPEEEFLAYLKAHT